jgi:homeobox-leucine zipper protein
VVSYPLLSPTSVPPRPLDLGIGGFGGQPGIGGGDMYGAGDLLRSISGPTEADKPMIIELAVAAMEELIGMAQMGDPLWLTTLEGGSILNEEEYVRSFPRGIGPKPAGFKCEASRETSVVIMNHVNLVEILMDVVHTSFNSLNEIMSYFT